MTTEEAKKMGWADESEAFAKWYNEVDAIVELRLGMGVENFPDWDFGNTFTCGDGPEEAAAQFIEDTLDEMGLTEEDF
jgi:hypothetical protein